MKPLVSVLIVTRERTEELCATLASIREQTYPHVETIVVDNGSSAEVRATNADLIDRDFPDVRVVFALENLGVCGGRNLALSHAKGEYVVEIDDDAVFEQTDAIDSTVELFTTRSRVGIIAFRIVNYNTGRITWSEFPFKNKMRNPHHPGPAAWFIGAGHAFRRSMIDRVGLYQRYFPWGHEEMDYALRAMDSGFQIHYLPTVAVLHKKAPGGRIANVRDFAAIDLANRIKVALLNLPWYSILTYSVIRTAHFSVKYRHPTLAYFATRRLMAEWDYIRAHRRRIRAATIWRLIALKGHLFF